MYYTSVDYLPIKRLYKLLETGDLSLLVIDQSQIDKASRSELEEIWEGIKEDYKELHPSSKFDVILDLNQQVDHLKAKHQMVELAIYVLRFGKDQEMIDVLNQWKYKVNPDKLQESLDAIELQAKGLQTKIGVKENQLEKMKEDSDDQKVDLNQILAMMSATLQITFKFNEVTVVEYFAFKKELERKAKAAKEAQARRKKHGRR